MKTVKITYEEFKYIKSLRYSYSAIQGIVCKKLGIKAEEIDDIDWNYGLTIYVYLK